MKKIKLKGEFICFEVRDKDNPKKVVGIDVFYNGIPQYRFMLSESYTHS